MHTPARAEFWTISLILAGALAACDDTTSASDVLESPDASSDAVEDVADTANDFGADAEDVATDIGDTMPEDSGDDPTVDPVFDAPADEGAADASPDDPATDPADEAPESDGSTDDSSTDSVADPDQDPPPPDVTEDSPTDESGDEPIDLTPSVTANDQTLSDLSTIVTVSLAVSDGPGFIAIHEGDGFDGIGSDIGYAPVASGQTSDLDIELERPANHGETLYAMLYADAGTIGTFEPDGADKPVTDPDSSETIAPPFDVTVPNGTPAIRFTLSSSGVSDYVFSSAEPQLATQFIAGGSGAKDPVLTLVEGWRYQVDNTVSGPHPFELLEFGANSGDQTQDIILLSEGQNGMPSSLESDGTVDWIDGSSTIRFTVSESLASQLTGYRCFIHKSSMRGSISLTTR